ncbi:AzlD domain-containing protein [Micromonospora sp. C31]|uniref:AzlD domain-containing protein n=1 Tax=Micromonospora sp. C31 TaxID=2824876 RepID=UPI001B365BB8|nr:AzlD domain-containing protein [Micromonospora sp. C31]MBQ1075001.1 AzlD domain-containing protein [Micromonospora sp. C31]
MSMLLLILGMGLATFAPRYLPLLVFRDRVLPDDVKVFLGYLPPALLAAIAVPSVIAPVDNRIEITVVTVPYLVAGLVTLVTGLFVERFMIVWTVGLLVFFGLRWWLGAA